jgi:hypothetical protein
MHVEPSHLLHEIPIYKTFGQHFWLGLMRGSMIWEHSNVHY